MEEHNILLNVFVSFLVGYFWFPVWNVFKKIFNNAWKATYGKDFPGR